MKKLKLFFVLFYLLPLYVVAQKNCNLHIITAFDNMPMHFPIHCEINGQAYKFKAGQCMELKLVTDSVTIIMKDKRWVKKGEIHLHEAAKEDLYVRLFYGWIPGEKNKIRLIAEAICQTCYDELKKKCRARLSD